MKTKTFWIVVISFSVYYYLLKMHSYNFEKNLIETTGQNILSGLITSFIVGLPIFIGVLQLGQWRDFLKNIGLQGNFLSGFLFPFLAALPMIIAFTMYFPAQHFSAEGIFFAFISVFFMELFFRGFFFRQLFQHTNLGFIPIVLIGLFIYSFPFHLFSMGMADGTILTEIKFFLLIFASSSVEFLFYTWLYAEWKNNLWTIVFFHFFLGFSYSFHKYQSKEDVTFKAIFLVGFFLLMILFTIIYKLKNKIPFAINKNTLWVKKHSEK